MAKLKSNIIKVQISHHLIKYGGDVAEFESALKKENCVIMDWAKIEKKEASIMKLVNDDVVVFERDGISKYGDQSITINEVDSTEHNINKDSIIDIIKGTSLTIENKFYRMILVYVTVNPIFELFHSDYDIEESFKRLNYLNEGNSEVVKAYLIKKRLPDE